MGKTQFLYNFLHQEVPRSGRGMPTYYRTALFISEAILAGYFLAGTVLSALATGAPALVPIAVILATAACLWLMDKLSARANLACVATIIGAWLTWFVHTFGWSAGSPNILVPVLSLAFFNIYEPPRGKIAYCLGLIGFRVVLFAYSLHHAPTGALNHTVSLFFQVINSIIPLVILSINYILFSSSIQASERQLTINNQELHKEAGTDPLTQLPNRRAMLDVIEQYRANNPSAQFGIAIADIDFFKKVNDTYGHNCGDYTLVELSRLFLAEGEGKYMVCRWGGEEFCFFMPEMNLDQAGVTMQQLHSTIRKLPLHFGDEDFSITVTIGVEEYDFKSPTDAILDRADRKLYLGKVHGRDQVVI